MESFSVWNLNVDSSFEQTMEIYESYTNWRVTEIDPYNGETLEFSIEVIQEDDFEFFLDNDEENNIRFAQVNYRREKVYSIERNNPLRDKRIKLTDVTFFVFEYMGSVNFIALRGSGPNTLTALRAANNCTNNNEIVADNLDLTEDFFYWVFQRHMNHTNRELYPGSNTFVDALTGFSGNTRDEVNNMWGRGNRISRILVTLAFLFNNESLKSLTPDFKYQDENLEVELTLSGTFKFNEQSHIGRYIFEHDPIKKKACLLMLFVLEIFPNVKRAYNNHLADETWGADHQLNFIAGIGSEIQDRVEEKLQAIRLMLEEDEE
ncbi:hypothetical protein E1I69_23395 [Bacillus timonensis]|uniref:Uncharacterized protein n=1 Tax=Bacillus timonensis TaxID=1033734 RepID=A0A4S3PIG4_9BACI|nr:hypothetical protein [Bacillus timonensis]THE09170.1 hypothetical protein E1I69_23395 [Bacillus timonensis]